MALTDQTRTQAREIIARYPVPRSALLPMLHLVQAEEGYVSPAGIAFCAEELELTKAQVAAVATFYTMYKRRPVGDYLVSVCTNTMCGVLGGNRTFEALSERLGVGHDQTTEDGRITLEHAECLAACDYAPVLTVNYEFFDQMDPDAALDVVKQLQDGGRPQPSRGARLSTFREIEMLLAGFPEANADVLADGPAGAPTLAGARLAEDRGVSVPGFDPSTPINPAKASAPAGPLKAGSTEPEAGTRTLTPPPAVDVPKKEA
ncbi:MAG: NADH-quinone oxidoreductase subunit [Actinomycetota bacterium]|jgi:NADH-quinone oxidoreductase subunit E|nr:NADH-quinone oxidoreductase subunit [Actinomycetota bacterium]